MSPHILLRGIPLPPVLAGMPRLGPGRRWRVGVLGLIGPALLAVLACLPACAAGKPEYSLQWDSLGSEGSHLDSPIRLAAGTAGEIYVVDGGLRRVLIFDGDGKFLGNFTERAADSTLSPAGIAVDGDGNVYISNLAGQQVQKYDRDGALLLEWGSPGRAEGQFQFPVDMDFVNGTLYVVDRANQRIQRFRTNGEFMGSWGSVGDHEGEFAIPIGIAADTSGNVYVSDQGLHRVQRFDDAGGYRLTWGAKGSAEGDLLVPVGVATDPAGDVYVADQSNNRIQKFNNRGEFLLAWGRRGPGPGEFLGPTDILIDGSGSIYVADRGNHRIQKFDVGRSQP